MHVFPGIDVLLLFGELLSDPHGPTPGYDGYLVDGVGLGQNSCNHCVAGLMVGEEPAFIIGQCKVFSFEAHHYFVP